MKKIVFVSLASLLVTLQSHASIGGGKDMASGSYECTDSKGELSAKITYPTRTSEMVAEITIKGTPVTLECQKSMNVDRETLEFLALNYVRSSNVCTGEYTKGSVIAGSHDSMGQTQFTAFLVDGSGNIKAQAEMDCEKVKKPVVDESGW